jgi:hypothetical protein
VVPWQQLIEFGSSASDRRSCRTPLRQVRALELCERQPSARSRRSAAQRANGARTVLRFSTQATEEDQPVRRFVGKDADKGRPGLGAPGSGRSSPPWPLPVLGATAAMNGCPHPSKSGLRECASLAVLTICPPSKRPKRCPVVAPCADPTREHRSQSRSRQR